MESSGNQVSGAPVAGNGIAERDDAAGVAAVPGGTVHALGGAFEELAALVGGDGGMNFEVERVLDVLIGGAERDAEGLEEFPDAEKFEGVATEAIGADEPDLGEVAGASVTYERTTIRSLLQRDGSRDTIVLVMLEDDNTRLGTQTAV